MQKLGFLEISNQDCDYLIDGLAKLLACYEVDKTSTSDLNFYRQMKLLHKKLEKKRSNIKSKKMTKQDIIDHLTHNCGLRGSSAIAAVNGAIEVISSALANGDSIFLRGFGTFKPETRGPRPGYNFKTGSTVEIPAQKIVKFIPGKELKERMNS